MDDYHSLGFYRKVVDIMSENLIYQALSEVKDTCLMGKLKKSRGALFNKIISKISAFFAIIFRLVVIGRS